MNIFYLDRDQIRKPTQPWDYDDYDVESIIEGKIKLIQQGLDHQHPIEVAPFRKLGSSGQQIYYVIDGRHRLEAFDRLGVDKIPCCVEGGCWEWRPTGANH